MTITLQALSSVEKAEPVKSSLHTTLEGPMAWVNARWMWSLHIFLHDLKWIMFHGQTVTFQKPPLGSRPRTKLGVRDTLKSCNCWFIMSEEPAWIEIRWNSMRLRIPVTYDFILHLRARDHTTLVWKCLGTVKILHDLIKWIMFHGHLDCFSKTTSWR